MEENNIKISNDMISDSEMVQRVKNAVRLDMEKKKAMNIPIAVYDAKTGKIYAEYNDGTRILMGSRIKRGNYGE